MPVLPHSLDDFLYIIKQLKSTHPFHPLVDQSTSPNTKNKARWKKHPSILFRAVMILVVCVILVLRLAIFIGNLGVFVKAYFVHQGVVSFSPSLYLPNFWRLCCIFLGHFKSCVLDTKPSPHRLPVSSCLLAWWLIDWAAVSLELNGIMPHPLWAYLDQLI